MAPIEEKITLGGVSYEIGPLTIWQLKDALPHLHPKIPRFAVVSIVVWSLVRGQPGIAEAVVQKAIRDATNEEMKAAYDAIMRLSGCVPKGSDAPLPARDPAWGSIRIGNRDFILGMVPTNQLQAIMDHRAPGTKLSPVELLDSRVRDVQAALAPNNDGVTAEFLEHNLDIPTADRIVWNVRGQIDMCLPSGREIGTALWPRDLTFKVGVPQQFRN